MDETWDGGHLNDPSWWWGVALDGIVGGILAGMIAASAVWFTLRHERQMHALSSAAESASRVLAQSIVLPTSLKDAGSRDEQSAAVRALFAAAIELSARLAKWWPSSARRVQTQAEDMYEWHRTRLDVDDPDVWRFSFAEKVAALAQASNDWLMDSPRPESWLARRRSRRSRRSSRSSEKSPMLTGRS